MFRFGSPEYLYLLAFLPLLTVLFFYLRVRQRRRLARFGCPETLQVLMPDVSPRRVFYKFCLLLGGLLFLILALGRPQFGSKLKEVTREGIEIMLAVDVSNSMLAEDFEPNRLEYTKFAISRLLEQLHQDRIGVIVFAGDAYVQLPITSDYAAAISFVQSLSPDMVSRQGTAIGTALELSAQSFSSGSDGSRVIILISDGENHEDDALAAAETIAEQGIKIYTIGIGTPEGSPISMNGDFLKDEQGNMAITKLDEALLEKIAVTTGGSYIRATKRSLGLSEIIEKINSVEKRRFSTQLFEEFNEQYQYFAGMGLFLIVLSFVLLSRKNKLFSRYNIFVRSRK